MLIFNHSTKFGAKNFDRRPNFGPKTKFNMAAAAILNLHPVLFLTHSRLFTVDLNHHTKFGSNISNFNRQLTYDNFSKFKMAAVRHLEFSKI